MAERFEASEEECLAHYAEVVAQRVEKLDAVVGGIAGQFIIVGLGCERVVENLVEAFGAELFADEVAQGVVAVLEGLRRESRADAVADLHVVVAVDAEHILDHVTRTGHVHTIGGHFHLHFLVCDLQEVHFEALEDGDHGLGGDFLANERVEIVESEVDAGGFDHRGIDVGQRAADLASGKLLDHQGGQAEHVESVVGIHAAFEAER